MLSEYCATIEITENAVAKSAGQIKPTQGNAIFSTPHLTSFTYGKQS